MLISIASETNDEVIISTFAFRRSAMINGPPYTSPILKGLVLEALENEFPPFQWCRMYSLRIPNPHEREIDPGQTYSLNRRMRLRSLLWSHESPCGESLLANPRMTVELGPKSTGDPTRPRVNGTWIWGRHRQTDYRDSSLIWSLTCKVTAYLLMQPLTMTREGSFSRPRVEVICLEHINGP